MKQYTILLNGGVSFISKSHDRALIRKKEIESISKSFNEKWKVELIEEEFKEICKRFNERGIIECNNSIMDFSKYNASSWEEENE